MKHFITFTSFNMIGAGQRLINQAWYLKLFDTIKLFTPIDLIKDKEFWDIHKPFIESNERGYGYWIWKSYIIKKTLTEIADGDILLYLDAGCEIDSKKAFLLQNAFDICQKDVILGTGTQQKESSWTKKDLSFIYPIDNTEQRQGGVIMMLACPKVRELVDEWYMLSSDYHLLDDSPSIIPNPPAFVEHRHDQSIWSLLTKKYGLYSKHSMESVIDILRNITSMSKLEHYELM